MEWFKVTLPLRLHLPLPFTHLNAVFPPPQAVRWDPYSAPRRPAVVLCQMFKQKEGQKTQEKETQTALRLCKRRSTYSGTFVD